MALNYKVSEKNPQWGLVVHANVVLFVLRLFSPELDCLFSGCVRPGIVKRLVNHCPRRSLHILQDLPVPVAVASG